MKKHKGLLNFLIWGPVILMLLASCKKIKQYDHKPELESLRQGLKTSAAVAYCASKHTDPASLVYATGSYSWQWLWYDSGPKQLISFAVQRKNGPLWNTRPCWCFRRSKTNARYNYKLCSQNPISGTALSQNFKAGGAPYIDLGNSYISFTKRCDGKAYVDFSSGKYTSYFQKHIDLGLE